MVTTAAMAAAVAECIDMGWLARRSMAPAVEVKPSGRGARDDGTTDVAAYAAVDLYDEVVVGYTGQHVAGFRRDLHDTRGATERAAARARAEVAV